MTALIRLISRACSRNSTAVVLTVCAVTFTVAGCTAQHARLVPQPAATSSPPAATSSPPAATSSQTVTSATPPPLQVRSQASVSSRAPGGESGNSAVASSVAASNAEVPVAVTATMTSVQLPTALSRVVAVALNGEVIVTGGLDSRDVTTSQILIFDPVSAAIRLGGHLAIAVHDASAGVTSGRALVLGGGSATSTTAVQTVSSDGTAVIVGRLPQPCSDDSAAVAGDVLYVLGGYDGTHEVSRVLATMDGVTFRQIGQLGETVRYGAAYASPDAVWMLGGEHRGTPIADIQRVDTRTGVNTVVGKLPHPLAHAAVAVVDGKVLLLGGSDGHNPQNTIYAFDPVTGSVRLVGSLPESVSDMAAAVVVGTAYVMGGNALTATQKIVPTTAIVAVSIS